MVSLKQTKNFKKIIEEYPFVGTGGGGKILQTKTKLYFEKKEFLSKEKTLHNESGLEIIDKYKS